MQIADNFNFFTIAEYVILEDLLPFHLFIITIGYLMK